MSAFLAIFWSITALGSGDVDPFSPLGILGAERACEVCLSVEQTSGVVPVFSASPRDEQKINLAGAWFAHETVGVRITSSLQSVSWPDGLTVNGAGDIKLGTTLRVLDRSNSSLWLDWSAKMPNAQDTSGLGTDETDLTVGAYGRWSNEHVGLVAGGELQVLGDPLQYANQDDALLVGAAIDTTYDSLHFRGRVTARLESPRNPLDLSVGLGVQRRKGSWGYGLNGAVGLSPAAADYSISASIHRIWACPTPNGD